MGELHFWVRLRTCTHSFHATCMHELLNTVSAGQHYIHCPLCKVAICTRRRARPVDTQEGRRVRRRIG
jgi:hypothetical protein